MKFILIAFLIYLAYLFVFRLVLPVYLTSRKIKKSFREMQEKMQEHMKGETRSQYNSSGSSSNTAQPSTKKAGDYIDFEEIK